MEFRSLDRNSISVLEVAYDRTLERYGACRNHRLSSVGGITWVRLGATASCEQTHECNKTNRVSGNHPDTLITEVRGSYRPNTHSCWLLLFVHENVTHACYAFINSDVVPMKNKNTVAFGVLHFVSVKRD